MKALNRLFACVLVLITACQEKIEKYESGQSLGEVVLDASECTTSISVDYDCLWRVYTPAEWISTDVDGRAGSSAFSFTVMSNESDMTISKSMRKAPVIITRLDKYISDTLWIIQRGIPDGKDYVTHIESSKIELQQEPLTEKHIIYCNLQGVDTEVAASWLKGRKEDIVAAVWTIENVNSFIDDERFVVRHRNLMVIGESDNVIPSSESLIVNVAGLNVQVADFTEDESNNHFLQIASILDEGYNIPSSSSHWLIGGSFYYLSSTEFGYPSTPHWYPSQLKDPVFDADIYAWTNNLIDCIWMTSKTYNPTYTSSEGYSWRADYVYASKSAWNSLIDVTLLEESGLKHKPILIKIKY